MSKTGAHWRHTYRMDNNDMLTCDICCEPFDDVRRQPKFLVCHHSYCEACLLQVASEENLECPSCRQVTRMSCGGVSGLQTNFYISHMRDTLKKIGSPKVKGCAKHYNQPLSFFCQKCSATICRDCTVLEHKEREGHEIKDIAEAEVEQRTALRSEVARVKAIMEEAQTHMRQLETERHSLTLVKDDMLKDIEVAFDKYCRLLELRKLQLCKELTDIYNLRQEKVLKHSEDINADLKELTKVLAKCEMLQQRGPLPELVVSKTRLQHVAHKIKSFIDALEVGDNNLLYDAKEGELEVQARIGQLGRIYVEEGLPTRVQFDVSEYKASLPAILSLFVFTYKGDKLRSDSIGLTVTDPAGTHLEVTLTWQEKHCSAFFIPQMKGEHVLVATFRGQPIRDAETTVTVQGNNPVATIGSEGEGEGKFRSPRAIAVHTDGCLFVADTGNQVIQKLDRDGQFLFQFAISGDLEATSTCDLALSRRDDVIVCTETVVGTTNNPTVGNTVSVYSRQGELSHKFNNKAMKCALCVATNHSGQIIISDYLKHSLFMYQLDGTFVRRISHSGCFNHPAFICVTEDDMIIVSDTNNDTVQIFDPEGNFLHSFGRSGSGKGELRQPFGVGCDGDHIVVVDSGNHRIQVFKRDGSFVSVIDSAGSPLNQPRGVALTHDGHVYVADRDNHCIKKYRYK